MAEKTKPKDSTKPKVAPKAAPQGAPVESAATKKAALEKKLKDAKEKIKGRTIELKGTLKKNMTLETFATGVENVKKLREKITSAPIGLIKSLEDKYPGITLAAFTTHLKGQVKLNFKEWSSDTVYGKFKTGDEYKIDFLGNSDAENQWGVSDMASIEWRGITKYVGGNKNIKRTSQRRLGLKGQDKSDRGFYDSSGYIAIHSNDVIVFSDHKPEFKTEFRTKTGDKYNEINEESYVKYASSKYSKEDEKYLKQNINNYTFVRRKPTISSADIKRIRAAIGSLEGMTPAQRVEVVARFLIKEGNNIRAKHCGDWVEQVCAIAGITQKRSIYHDLSYAFKGGDYKKNGWKENDDPTRRDCRESGKYAKKYQLDKINAGTILYINNHNKFDHAGNHRVIFLRWKNRNLKLAEVVSWYGNNSSRKNIKVYDLNKMPVTHISQPVQASDALPSDSEAENYMADASKQELIKRGSTPFPIKIGYRKTREEERWYQSTREEGRRLRKMNINERIVSLQEDFRYEDALKYSAIMVGIDPKKNPAKYKLFVAMNDAVLRVESNYNPYNHNHRGGKIALSTAAGEYQLLNSVWHGARKYQSPKYKRQFARIGLNHDMYSGVNMTAPRPELATPYQRTIVHNMFMFRYTKLLRSLIAIPDIFEKIQRTSGRVRRSYIRIIYLVWRNGPGGAGAFHRNMRKYERTGDEKYLMPETAQQTEDYYQNNLTQRDWQKGKRSKSDYRSVMRVTKIFANRFEKNLRQLG